MASWENEGKESIFVIWEELLQKDNDKYQRKNRERKKNTEGQ